MTADRGLHYLISVQLEEFNLVIKTQPPHPLDSHAAPHLFISGESLGGKKVLERTHV